MFFIEIQGPGQTCSVGVVGGGRERNGEPALLLRSQDRTRRENNLFQAGAASGAQEESVEELWEPHTGT